MICIYLDSSQKDNQIYLLNDSKIIKRYSFRADNNSDSQLLAEFDKFLKKNKLTLNNIDKLIVNIGPGSFTGTRNGLTLANGFKLALLDLKLIGLSNPTDSDIIASLDKPSVDILLPIYAYEPTINKPRTP